MAEDGTGDGGDVFPADDVGAEQGGAGFGTEDEVLHGAGAGTPTDEGFEPFGGIGGAGAGAAAFRASPYSLRKRCSAGISTVELADLTNSPISLNFSRTNLLSTPNSFASSWTRVLATILLLA